MNYCKWLIVIVLFNLVSCKKEKNTNSENFSKKIIGKSEYDKIYKQANDSIKLWIKEDFSNYKMQKYSTKWKVNNLLCFNSNKDKFVTCLMNIKSDEVNNSLNFFYGVKIKEKWYFFTGATVYCFSELFGLPKGKPLSFEKLHEIALKEVFSGYLKEKKPIVPFWKFWQKQEYEIDESYFDKHFRGQGWGGGDWIEDPDGSNGHWNGRIYTDEEFNKMYKEKALSVWPSSNPLTSFYDINIKRWRNIHQDSFDILLKAKKINPNGTAVE